MAAAWPGVLGGGVQGGAGEVEPDAGLLTGVRVGAEPLGLDAGEQAQRLGVALEAAAVPGDLAERLLAVVPERRVAQVVREAGGLDQVGIAAQGGGEVAPDLGALQRVGEPGAGCGVPHAAARTGSHHLGLAREPAQRGGVQHAGPVPLIGGPARPLVRLRVPPLHGGDRRLDRAGLLCCRHAPDGSRRG